MLDEPLHLAFRRETSPKEREVTAAAFWHFDLNELFSLFSNKLNTKSSAKESVEVCRPPNTSERLTEYVGVMHTLVSSM